MECEVSFTREEEGRCEECRGDGLLLDKTECKNCFGTGGADNEYECTAKVWATPSTPNYFDVGFGNWLPGDAEDFQLISMSRNDTGEDLIVETGDEEMIRDNFDGHEERDDEPWN